MARESFRLPDWQSDGLKDMAENYISFTKTDIAEMAIGDWLKEHEDELPEHVTREAKHDKIVRENKPLIREARFKQKVQMYLDDVFEKPFPPEPYKWSMAYFESLRREVRQEYDDDYQEEFLEFIDDREEWYSETWNKHHTGETGKDAHELYADLVKHAAVHVKHSRTDMAVDYIEKADENGRLPDAKTRQEAIDDARKMAGQDGWMDEWEDAVSYGD